MARRGAVMYDVCPSCGSEDVEAVQDGDAIQYGCRSCDWQLKSASPFFLGAWSVRLQQALAPLDILSSLMTDPDGVSFLKSRIKGVSYLSSFPLDAARAESSDEYLRGEMDIAYNVYLRQSIVLAATYVELVLADFFQCLYHAYPLRMNDVLPPRDKARASIPLDQIVASDSKEVLLSRLAVQAGKLKTDNEPHKTVKQLVSDCGIRLERPLVEDLKRFRELRNQIVHDGTEVQVTVSQVHEVFGIVLYLLFVLGQACEA